MTGQALRPWRAFQRSLFIKSNLAKPAVGAMLGFAQILARAVYFFFVLPSRYFLNLDRWKLMLFFFLGGACGPSMHSRNACSTTAHPADAYPADAQHAV